MHNLAMLERALTADHIPCKPACGVCRAIRTSWWVKFKR